MTSQSEVNLTMSGAQRFPNHENIIGAFTLDSLLSAQFSHTEFYVPIKSIKIRKNSFKHWQKPLAKRAWDFFLQKSLAFNIKTELKKSVVRFILLHLL